MAQDLIKFGVGKKTAVAIAGVQETISVLANDIYVKGYANLTPTDFSGEYADPQYWAQHSEKDSLPYSPEQHYADEGIYLQQGVRGRKVGAKIIYDAFDPIEDDVPRIRFTSNCTNCIEHIPALPSSELDVEDVDSNGEDHEYDALRYGGTIILPGLTSVINDKKGWRSKMARKYAYRATAEDDGSTWKNV